MSDPITIFGTILGVLVAVGIFAWAMQASAKDADGEDLD